MMLTMYFVAKIENLLLKGLAKYKTATCSSFYEVNGQYCGLAGTM